MCIGKDSRFRCRLRACGDVRRFHRRGKRNGWVWSSRGRRWRRDLLKARVGSTRLHVIARVRRGAAGSTRIGLRAGRGENGMWSGRGRRWRRDLLKARVGSTRLPVIARVRHDITQATCNLSSR